VSLSRKQFSQTIDLTTPAPRIDDIQDSSVLRRGAPSAHTVFGPAQTINSANYVYFLAMQELYKLGPQSGAALQIYCEEMLNLHRGQGMDLYWRDTLTLPSEEAYMKMISNKTGGLFRLAVRLMGTVSTCTIDFMPLVEKIGLIFQIRDDYKNLVSNEVCHNRTPHPY
jgi:geranylgeranyl diphosphate synthase, type III